MDDSTIN